MKKEGEQGRKKINQQATPAAHGKPATVQAWGLRQPIEHGNYA
ncbi:MAG: hypothetical protein U1E48_08765 [Paracoccaceae bacterium]